MTGARVNAEGAFLVGVDSGLDRDDDAADPIVLLDPEDVADPFGFGGTP